MYWAMTLTTCVPAGAPSTSDGSTSDGIVASRTGSSETRPYFDASNARSIASMPGRDDDPAAEQRLVVAAGGGEPRQPVEDEVDLRHDARRPVVAGPPEHRRPDGDRVAQPDERPLRVEPADDGRAP